jgi:hypothetical protein
MTRARLRLGLEPAVPASPLDAPPLERPRAAPASSGCRVIARSSGELCAAAGRACAVADRISGYDATRACANARADCAGANRRLARCLAGTPP